MVFTVRYQTALNEINSWMGARNHFTELTDYLRLLGFEQKVIRERAAMFRKEFEDASGITRTTMQMDEEDAPSAPDIIASASLFHDSIMAEQDLNAEMQIQFDALRVSERFKNMLDQRDVLAQEMRSARVECMRREDHPLVSVRKNPRERWMTMLDERNYDLSNAKTMSEKLEVETNLRDLAADEADTKARNDAEEKLWQQRIEKAKSIQATLPTE